MRAADIGPTGFGAGRGSQVLERLRERVEVAARELERLRKDNILLARRIAELEARPAVEQDQSFLVFDESEEVLRRKVEGYIQAIDAYLARERERAREPEK
jgi:hypothetical protein